MKGSVETDLVRKMWGRYLQDERKYDKWGAQGKLLVMQEILAEEGGNVQAKLEPGAEYQKMTNEVFPRTFYCARQRPIGLSLTRAILEYLGRLERELGNWGLSEQAVESTSLEETAERFCIPVERLKNIVDTSSFENLPRKRK